MTFSLLAVADSPLVFRSGRPFGAADAGGGGDSLDFPLPATTAGALRAAWCDAVGHQHAGNHDALLHQLHVRGPLRCTVSAGGVVEPWLPAPADAVQAAPARPPLRQPLLRLAPQAQPDAVADPAPGCDLPFGLQPLRMPAVVDTVAVADGWSLPEIESWLHRPENDRQGAPRTLRWALPADRRTHVAMDLQTQRALDKGLFASEGIDFTLPAAQAASVQGLLLFVDAPQDVAARLGALAERHGRLGADGRTAAYLALEGYGPPPCPDSLRAQLDDVKVGDMLRLYLATPACYLRNGWYPDGLRPDGDPLRLRGTLPGLEGWRFELEAAAVGRFVGQAGYAMQGARKSAGDGKSGGAGKPLRRLVPAGSMYWLRVLERSADAPALSERWWCATCYVEFARDGHGLGLWGLA